MAFLFLECTVFVSRFFHEFCSNQNILIAHLAIVLVKIVNIHNIPKNDLSLKNDDAYVVAEVGEIVHQIQTQTTGSLCFKRQMRVDWNRQLWPISAHIP